MILETNIQDRSARISLARAAKLTGYHQDYLGQLCRLGKLEAVKVGRNWFTSPEALNNLSASVASLDSAVGSNIDAEIQQIAEEVEQEQEEQNNDENLFSQPVIAENITISEVEGMPVAIRTMPATSRNTNSVQNILTNLRIESLQQEVMELRKLLFRLMDEVKSHTNILQTRETVNRVQDSLKHSYVSNFDFNTRDQITERKERIEERINQAPLIWEKPKRAKYVLVNWVAATTALVAISFIGLGLLSNTFLGSEPQTATLYYREVPKQQSNEPEVAGATTVQIEEILPTDSTGELTPVMIR